jgi:alpha-amylase/alpha-mannosidase (GH57 family)
MGHNVSSIFTTKTIYRTDMDDKDFEELKKDIKAYRDLKNEVLKKIETIKQEVREGKNIAWVIDAFSDELYTELYQSDVRQIFSKHAKRAGSDTDFEKYFRSAYLEIYFGIIINPKYL